MRPLKYLLFLYILLTFATAASSLESVEESDVMMTMASMNWIEGPGSAGISGQASIDLPEGYAALDAADTTQLMELMENPSSGRQYFVGPMDLRWFAVFEYEDTGYIKDDDEIDPDALLDTMRQGTEAGNRERRERGWAELRIVGWQYEPFYEQETNRLAWAILAESEGFPIVNYNTRLLGRSGVMSATLVADPDSLDQAVDEFRGVLEGFDYNTGQRYAEFQPGDKIATYGLAALVAGGAAAAVVKSGAGKGLFKLIGLGILAGLAAIGSFFKRIFGRSNA